MINSSIFLIPNPKIKYYIQLNGLELSMSKVHSNVSVNNVSCSFSFSFSISPWETGPEKSLVMSICHFILCIYISFSISEYRKPFRRKCHTEILKHMARRERDNKKKKNDEQRQITIPISVSIKSNPELIHVLFVWQNDTVYSPI